MLLIYRHPKTANAPTIMEHINSFKDYSSFNPILLNTENGFPRGLYECHFDVIVLHYSLFGTYPFQLNKNFERYISNSKALKVAFFQDEMIHCHKRFQLIDNLGIDVIYSLLEPRYFQSVYKKNTRVKNVRHTLTGYVSDDLIRIGNQLKTPFSTRDIDVGYRARKLDYFYGRGAREKSEIAVCFVDSAKQTNLKLDISTQEKDRIYGFAWYEFMANCRFMLGAMAGTSIFDINGDIKMKTEAYINENKSAKFTQVEQAVLFPYEKNINYRMISPRIFECIALRVCLVLYKDDYQGVLKPWRHYIPLEKDFSNINLVLAKMQDKDLVTSIIENSYQDIILSGKWHYREFMKKFDNTLEKLMPNLSPMTPSEHRKACHEIKKDAIFRASLIWAKSSLKRPFPGRKMLVQALNVLGIRR